MLMRNALAVAVTVGAFVLGEPPALAQVPPPEVETSAAPGLATSMEENWGLSVYVDQDSVYPWIAPWGGDQNYTMGVGIQLTGRKAAFAAWPVKGIDWVFGLGRLHQRFRESGSIRNPDGTRSFAESHSLMLQNGAFTPREISSPDPIYDDRPYASIIGLTGAHATIDFLGRRVIKTELTVGFLGLRVSEWVQTAIHRSRRANNRKDDPTAMTPYDPEGWTHQISDGGELTAKYTATWLEALSESGPHDVALQVEGSLGYYTNVAVGFTGRLGVLRSDFWTIRANPLTSVNQGVPEAVSARAQATPTLAGKIPVRDRSRNKLEAYVFTAARARLVVYNALLQGAFRDSEVTIPTADVERVVPEFDVGLTLAGWGCNLTLAATRRSTEYGVGEPRSHTWGGIYFSYRSR